MTLLRIAAISLMGAALASAMHAQAQLASAPLPDASSSSAEITASAIITPVVIAPAVVTPAEVTPIAVTPVAIVPSYEHPEHNFFDPQNRVLLIASAALNGADFAVTRSNLQSGGQELNPMVRVFGRSTAGLAVNFVGETASVVSLGYFFHKIGHHKLERAVFLVNIGSSAGAVTYGLTHR